MCHIMKFLAFQRPALGTEDSEAEAWQKTWLVLQLSLITYVM